MKKDWTYKKLGEVAEIVGGSTPKTSEPANWEGSNMWVTPAELDGSKYFGKTQRTISDDAASKLQLLPIGTVLFSSRAPIGKVAITTAPMYCNQGFKNIVCGDSLYNEYVYWCLKYNVPLLQSLGVGATFKELSKSAMSDFSIPIPPLSIQYSIVRELDLLHSMIEKKKEQLCELDNLAQSLFYLMFGDPITNPMGWEIKKLGEVAETTSGGTPSKSNNEYYENGTIPWLRSGEVSQGFIYKTELFITQKGLDNSSAKMIPVDSVAIAMYGATVGEVGIIKSPMCTNQAICSILPNKYLVPIYLRYFLMAMKPKYIAVAAGGAQPNISQAIIRNTHLPLPPLSLQQSFAAKIEAIEAQKALVRQSIEEAQTLLAAQMQYYFE